MPNDNSSIIVCGQRYDVGQRVITWEDDPSISAYTLHCVTKPDQVYPWAPAPGLGTIAARFRERRLIGQDRSLARLQQVLKQFVVHHDGMGTSRDTFRVLHDERGLSVHFLIDNNGDIYQTLDLVDCGFQAAGVNEISVGVELCNRGDALKYPEFYKGQRPTCTCTINRHEWLCFVYTEEQMQAMVNIGRALARILPGLPQDIPKGPDGEQLWDTLAGDPREFAGYLGHFHVTDRKWDPGPFDFKKFISQIKGRIFYPALPGKDAAVEVPAESEKAEEMATALFDNNEKEGAGGYFPVGPLGETKLWHSGVHLRDERGKPVVAPLSGKVVAARMNAEDDWPSIGSNNFVLIRHELAVGGEPVKFWTLLLHLDAEDLSNERAPGWMRHAHDKMGKDQLKDGVALLDIPVSAGEVIGHFGEAGPRGARQGQLHFEVMADTEFASKLDPDFKWVPLEGGATRFCDPQASAYNRYIVDYMDWNKNGLLQHQEVEFFFKSPDPRQKQPREAFRKYAIHHLSEWGDNGGDFVRALWASKEYRTLVPPARMRQVYEDQIQSMFWWTDEVGQAAGLPSDRMVWSYHPITFVLWIQEKTKGQVQQSKAIADAAKFGGKPPPADIMDDASEGAGGFMDDEDALFGEKAKSLTLEQLAEGYPD